MAVQGDTCLFSAFQMPSLKLLLCVNKGDRKWQFGSSNQECHSQLRPLPAPDTLHGRRGHGSDFFLFCSSPLFPPFRSLFICFSGHSIWALPTPSVAAKEKTEWCTEDTRQSDRGTFCERCRTTRGLSRHITLTACIKIPAMSLLKQRSTCPVFALLLGTEQSRCPHQGQWWQCRGK